MRSYHHSGLLALCLGFALCVSAAPTEDKCPKLNLACLDVINSSQCIEMLVLGNRNVTRDAMVKCVDTEGAASGLPGSTKVTRRNSGLQDFNEDEADHI